MYCVIQEIELKRQNPYGEYKELEAYKTTWTMNSVEYGSYSYRYTGGRFERPIKKAYKISVHHSYRDNGSIKKKQWSICTMSYYDIADGSTWIQDHMILSKWDSLLKEIGITEDKFCNMVYKKLDPLIEQIQEEFKQTEEYKTHQEYRNIIDKYLKDKEEFKIKYGSDSYDDYYDVFGVLREKEKFKLFKRQYDAAREQQSSYYKNYQSNYNSNYSFGSYSNLEQSNYTDKQKEYLKKIYRVAAIKLHPDVTKDDGEGMKFLNELKESWGI
ncbi:hypothetical protein ACUH7Y_25475 [Clostridium beijerinckii]|uniref:J domain-containing protein n=1 Tax=Clostridium beijerinckii TaxID=1520 RepID=A0A7X9SRT3_CLOBE|nr:hypothetical protein [Clostridium beijerinckii]NMF06583.1 hypothetical protein [Clostridium beijerinckii]